MSTSHSEFNKGNLLLEDLHSDPNFQFSKWLEEYVQMDISESVAMSFSTINKDGFPSSRMVYLRDFASNGFVFFTNFDSNKGEELRNNNKSSMLFYWPEMERQVRVWGFVEKVEEELSNTYFSNRPKGSKAGAWISQQSKEIIDRASLEKRHQEFLLKIDNKIISRPEFWGGFRLNPMMYEFWQGRQNRLHDRFLYNRKGENWEIKRLAP
ncbi:MAG: pyridoxamine 5'-phosphate oxidase [Bacteroidales bacterium]|nr:pyridoxamine 5'-phosphate oxidase [Bacteroidales bacterium]